MATTLKLILDKRHQKQNGAYPLVLRLHHNRRTENLPLKIDLKEKDWDDAKNIVNKNYGEVSSITRLNNNIQRRKLAANDVIEKFESKGLLNGLTIAELKKKIINESTSNSIVQFAEDLIENLRLAKRFGSANSYTDAINAAKNFSKNDQLKFENVTVDFLNKWEISHLSKGNSINGLAAYLRSIRAIFNKAINEGVTEEELYPFKKYKIKTKQPQKRALEKILLNKLIKKKFKDDSDHIVTRNYFLASYMLYGMNFIDMAYLKKSDISDGRIDYRRSKTSRLFDIKITPALKTILDHFIKADPDSKYVFPIIKRDDPELMYKDAKWARNRYNEKLVDLAKVCEIDKKLTSYVTRHSFATQAMLLEIPLEAISAMLGHKSLKTTQVYLDSLPKSTLDKYNEKLIKGLM